MIGSGFAMCIHLLIYLFSSQYLFVPDTVHISTASIVTNTGDKTAFDGLIVQGPVRTRPRLLVHADCVCVYTQGFSIRRHSEQMSFNCSGGNKGNVITTIINCKYLSTA